MDGDWILSILSAIRRANIPIGRATSPATLTALIALYRLLRAFAEDNKPLHSGEHPAMQDDVITFCVKQMSVVQYAPTPYIVLDVLSAMAIDGTDTATLFQAVFRVGVVISECVNLSIDDVPVYSVRSPL